MNFLKKIDHYLLLNYPTLWHSKIHFLIPTAIVLNLCFYFWGYNFTNDEHLIQENFIGYYFSSFGFLFHLLILITILIFWLISFLKKNAYKRLYPLKKYHFTILFVLFFISIIGLITPAYSFFKGSQAKIRTTHPWESYVSEIKSINLAKAFLPGSSTNYNFTDYYIWKLFVKTGHEYYLFNGNDTLKSYEGYDSYTYQNKHYSPHLHPENNIYIENKPFQFYLTKKIPCNSGSEKIISHFYTTNDDSTHAFLDFRNYHSNAFSVETRYYLSDLGITQRYLPNQEASLKHADFNDNENRSYFLSLIQEKNKAGITQVLENFKAILLKYRIQHCMDPEQLVRLFIQTDFSGASFRCYNRSYDDYEAPCHPISIETYLKEDHLYLASANEYQLERAMQNIQDAHTLDFSTFYFWTSVLITIGISIFFMLIYFSTKRGFIFSLVFFIALFIINLIIYISIFNWYREHHYPFYRIFEFKLITSQLLINCLLLILLGIWSIYKNWIKVLQEILLVSGFLVVGFFPLASVLFLDAFNIQFVTDECGDHNRVHVVSQQFLKMEYLVPAFVLCVFIYTRLFKKHIVNPSKT